MTSSQNNDNAKVPSHTSPYLSQRLTHLRHDKGEDREGRQVFQQPVMTPLTWLPFQTQLALVTGVRVSGHHGQALEITTLCTWYYIMMTVTESG